MPLALRARFDVAGIDKLTGELCQATIDRKMWGGRKVAADVRNLSQKMRKRMVGQLGPQLTRC